jgi:DNA polymerase-1
MDIHLYVDANNLAMRAVHASQGHALSSGGVPTGALMIFANTLCKIIAEETPAYVGVAWDGQSKYRRGLLPSYKANRKAPPVDAAEKDDAFLLMWGFLDAAGIPSFRHSDYEADDLIASWWHNAYGVGEDAIVIASGDKDFFQLTGENPAGMKTTVRRFGPAIDPADYWDDERVATELGFENYHWPLVTALTGDVSDNVIGVPGIGPKRAVKLLARNDWDLGKALEEIPEHRETVLRNLKLVDLRTAPLATLELPGKIDLPRYGADNGADLDEFFGGFELKVLQDKYRAHKLWAMPAKLPGRSMSTVTTQRGGGI